MKINRNGVEIELTDDELFEAYKEKQHKFDVDDIMSMKDYHDADDFVEAFGITMAELDNIADECATRYRRYMERFGGNWFDQVNEAIVDVVWEMRGRVI